MKAHSVERTSPKGQDFIGTCTLCGQKNMTLEQAMNTECPNIRGLTEDEAVVEAILGPKP